MVESLAEGNNKKPVFAGVGLVIGTGLGTVACILLDLPVYYAGVGTALGLIVGAIIDSYQQGDEEG